VFVALVPSRALQHALGALARLLAERGGRAVDDDNIHMTLAFLGDVATTRIETLTSMLGALPRARFAVTLDRLGAFGGAGVAWIGPGLMPAQLHELHAVLAAALQDGGFRVEERPFHPHLTLVRKWRGALAGDAPDVLEWPVDGVSLMMSESTASGVRYRALARVDFT